jgi:hypothetical protein
MGDNVFSDPKFTPTCTTRSATIFKRPYGYDRTAHTANNSERCSVSAFSETTTQGIVANIFTSWYKTAVKNISMTTLHSYRYSVFKCTFPIIVCPIADYAAVTKRIRKVRVSTVCEYFRLSAEVVISRMRAVFPHSVASHRRQY